MMVIENKFNIGDMVYLKTDPEQEKRVVYGISILGNEGTLIYKLAHGNDASEHYEFEIERVPVYEQ